MEPQGQADEEAANEYGAGGRMERYRDDPNDVEEEDENPGPDAPLRGSHRPSSEFDELLRQFGPSTWQDRISARIPPRAKKAWRATKEWVKGPQPPRIYTINPLFSKVQYAPIALLDRFAPKKAQRFWLLVFAYATWLLAFSLVLRQSSFAAQISGYGTPLRLGCQARYWSNGNGCGLNGDQCRPFEKAHLAFRCPAECHEAEIFNPHAVGDQEVVYKPLVIGGPAVNETGFEDELVHDAIYRGDSFICGSAVHAGFLSGREGGCGVLALTGEQSAFSSNKGHGIKSVGFDSYFPQSFGFLSGTRSECKDLRWPALIVTVIFTTAISLFTTSPAVFFWSIFVAVFFNVALATDPPSLTDYYSLLSLALKRFLPSCFCAWVTYRYTVERALTDLTAQVEKTILWLGPFWVGALNNYTFDKIPIQRLTTHDIKAQPGAVPALIIVVLSIFFIALGQAWAFRVEGRMPKYLLIYSIFVLSLLFMLAIPGLNLRIHHYILALLLLPGTSFQNRPSLIYQGLLVGMFINGTARWGFASILETPSTLFEGGPQGTMLPTISVLALGAKNITFNLGPLPVMNSKSGRMFDGISVLVNDVERFRGYGDNKDYWPDGWVLGGNFTWTWTRHQLGNDVDILDSDAKADAQRVVLPEYFRFAYMAGSKVGDYTKAGKWMSNGTWVPMKSGPS